MTFDPRYFEATPEDFDLSTGNTKYTVTLQCDACGKYTTHDVNEEGYPCPLCGAYRVTRRKFRTGGEF